MLARSVQPPGLSRVLLALGLGGALAASLWMRPAPGPTVVVAPIPVPVAVRVAAPYPIAVPVMVPGVATVCPSSEATIGAPLPLDEDTSHLDLQAAVSPDGCAIAAWHGGVLWVSWDAGATFTKLDTGHPIGPGTLSASRFVWMPDPKTVGIVDAGARTVRRIDVSSLKLETGSAVAGGGWLVIQSDTKLYASRDDGASWLQLVTPALPKGEYVWYGPYVDRIAPDGTLHLKSRNSLDAPRVDGPPEHYRSHEYEGTAAVGTWHEVVPRGWTYSMELDEEWGCGSNSKLVAHHGGVDRELASKLSDVSGNVEVTSGAGKWFAMYDSGYFELRAGAPHAFKAPVEGADDLSTLVGVDATGALLVNSGGRILRWSPAYGWRVLFSSPEN